MAILIRSELIERIRAEAEAAYPRECAGFLIGRRHGGRKDVTDARPVRADEGATLDANRFFIPPRMVWRNELRARRRGERIIGAYHSHPDARPVPSAADRGHAWPAHSSLIVEVTGGRARDMRAWILAKDRSRFVAEPMEVGA